MLQQTSGAATTNAFSQIQNPSGDPAPPPAKKKRNLPGTPDPDAEVIALSPKTLMTTKRFLCEICGKGFQRDQNLQLHRRGHNLPWKLRQRSSKEPRKRVYVCPEKSCVHHHASRALGDLTGIKKHFCRKHGEKKWKCDKCSKRYAVQSDWKAHSKVCGTREYRCDCGTLFSRRDSFVTHRAFCDALAEETARVSAASNINGGVAIGNLGYYLFGNNSIKQNLAQPFSSIFKQSHSTEVSNQARQGLSLWMNNNNLPDLHHIGTTNSSNPFADPFASCSNTQPIDFQRNWMYGNKVSSANSGHELLSSSMPTTMKAAGGHSLVSAPSSYSSQQARPVATDMSATALLQKAAQIGATSTDPHLLNGFGMRCTTELDKPPRDSFSSSSSQSQMYLSKHQNGGQRNDQDGGQTRDFLGVGIHSLCPSSIHEGWI